MQTVKKYLSAFSILVLASLPLTASANPDNGYGQQKVVYHMNYDDPKQQSSTLGNIQNHINAVGAENMDVRVVMHGDGLSLVLKPEALETLPKFKAANATQAMIAKIDSLKMQGVKFNVCANTVKGKDVVIGTHLHDAANSDVVASGVAEVAFLQGKGFSYIRP